jgi:hypothetical protein
MASRTYVRTAPRGTLDPRQLGEQIRTDRGWADPPGVAVTETEVLVSHNLIGAGDDAAIQAVINAYVYQPEIQPYVFTINGAAPIAWPNQPAALTEAPGGTRTRLPLHSATYARLTVHVTAAGFAGAELIAQISLDGVSWTSGPRVPIDSVGLKVSSLVAIPEQFRKDVLFRVAGQGGNGVADPQFGLITVQVA